MAGNDGDLSVRGGELTANFTSMSNGNDARTENIYLGSKDGINYVHEISSYGIAQDLILGAGSSGNIKTYNDKEFFAEHGDVSAMVTLDEYKSEKSSIDSVRDGYIHKAADLYNKAIDLGYIEDGSKIKYEGTRNYGRIERELNNNLQKSHEIPDIVVEQINSLRGLQSGLKNKETFMNYRLRDVISDMNTENLDLSNESVDVSKTSLGIAIK